MLCAPSPSHIYGRNNTNNAPLPHLSCAEQGLVVLEQHFVDFKDVVLLVNNEVFHDDIKLAGMGECVASPL